MQQVCPREPRRQASGLAQNKGGKEEWTRLGGGVRALVKEVQAYC
jgi:hypothetical protein